MKLWSGEVVVDGVRSAFFLFFVLPLKVVVVYQPDDSLIEDVSAEWERSDAGYFIE